MSESTEKTNTIFKTKFMPYIIKWGKITTWGSIPFIFLPPLMLMGIYGARVSVANVVAGLVPVVSAMIVWYIVDPVALYPILGVPGLYITYIAGNSKEIRGPSALIAMQSTGLKQGSPEGTVIATYGIALSVFISVAALTIAVIMGDLIISSLPVKIKEGLNYLLPALFGAMWAQSTVNNPKNALIAVPLAVICRFLFVNGFFKALPSGGSYMSILITVFGTMFIVKSMYKKKEA